MSDDIDRAELRRLHAAATPGPWEFTGRDDSTTWIEAPTGDVLIHDERGHGHMRENFSWIRKPDAEFIAAARTAVPALLDENAALQQEVEEYDQILSRSTEIMTGVANALNGPPAPLTSWSHHDLAEKAAAMVARAEKAEARIKAVREVHQHGGAMFGDGLEDHTHVCASCLEEWPCPTIRALDA